jgi:pimeloyl-ACP methyl ester carboxylesterase
VGLCSRCALRRTLRWEGLGLCRQRQVGDSAAAESASYTFALAEAERLNNRKAADKLRAIGPPPYPVSSLFRERFWVNRLQGQATARAAWDLGRLFLRGPELSLLDLPNLARGASGSLSMQCWPNVERESHQARTRVADAGVFFLGRHDRWVPPETSVAYFTMLTAPSKMLVWFDESGHEPFVDEADKFNASMADLVRLAAG